MALVGCAATPPVAAATMAPPFAAKAAGRKRSQGHSTFLRSAKMEAQGAQWEAVVAREAAAAAAKVPRWVEAEEAALAARAAAREAAPPTAGDQQQLASQIASQLASLPVSLPVSPYYYYASTGTCR